MLKEFREFALKGNRVDLAIGVIIGATFGGLVQSVVNDILMPCTPEREWKAIQSAGATPDAETTTEAQPHFSEGALNQDDPSNATEGGQQ